MTRRILSKSLKILSVVLLTGVVVLLAVVVYFNSAPGQKRLSHLLFSTLSKQIGTPIQGRLSFSIPDWIHLDDLLVIDQQQDTLLYAQKAYLDVALFRLLKNEVYIEQVELENAVAKIALRDEVFNFGYIIDAFSSAEAAPQDTTSVPMKIILNGIKATGLQVSYIDHDADQWVKVKLGALTSGFTRLDPQSAVYALRPTRIGDLWVDGKLGVASEDTAAAAPLPQVVLDEVIATNVNWNLAVGSHATSGAALDLAVEAERFDLPNMQFSLGALDATAKYISYRDSAAAPSREINFGDLGLSDVRLSATDVQMQGELLAADIKGFSFTEKSGLELRHFTARASKEAANLVVKDLDVGTARSRLVASITAHLDTVNWVKSPFEASIKQLQVAPSEVLLFASDLKSTLGPFGPEPITARGKLKGTGSAIQLQQLYFTAAKDTRMHLNGAIYPKEVMGLDLQIRDFSTTRADMSRFTAGMESIELPEQAVLNGSVKGNLDQLSIEAFLNGTQGGLRFVGSLAGLSKAPAYSGTLSVEDYAVGQLLRNPQLGTLGGEATFDGQGFDNPAVQFDVRVDEVGFSGEVYRNVALAGLLKDQQVTATGTVNDANARLGLDVVADMRGEAVVITGNTRMDRVDLKALGITEENIALQGDFTIHRLVADMRKPFIDFKGEAISAQKDSVSYPIGDLSVLTEYGETMKRLDLTARFMNLSLSGNFEYDQLQRILLTEVNKYFKLPDFQAAVDSLNYYFDINGTIEYDPVFTAFVPALKNFKPVTITSGLKSEGEVPFSGNISIPYLLYDSVQVVNTTFDFAGNGQRLVYGLLADQVSTPSFRLRKANLNGALSDNIATFDLSVKDTVDKQIHALAGLLESDGRRVRVSFDETGSMLFYEDWGGNPYGYIDYSPEGLVIDNVVFSSGEQVLRINSLSDKPNGPLMVFAERLDLNFLARAILQDSTFASGYLDLDLQLVNYMGEENLAFTGEVDIDDFHFNQVALGDLRAKAESENAQEIGVYATLNGLKNDFELRGSYYTQREEALDFMLDMGGLELQALGPFLDGIAYDLKGKISGNVTVQGQPTRPRINGELGFQEASFRIQETAALLQITEQALKIEQSKIGFNQFVVKDANGQEMVINGLVDLSTIPHFSYDLNLATDNFLIANSERGQSELFYGTAYLDSRLNVRGANAEFQLTGDITTREKTNLTLLLPDESVGEDLNSVVTFVDFGSGKKAVSNEASSGISLANAVNVNLMVDEKTTINMLMNPITGDMLTASGTGRLNLGFDNAGELFIIGELNILKGSYELTFQTIRKRFEITQNSNSTISFAGDPLKGLMDITAEYKVPGRKDVNTYPGLDEESAEKIFADIRVDLVLKGEVMNLSEVDFQIVAKETEVSAVASDLQELGWSIENDRGEKKSGTEGAVTSANREMLKQNAIMLLVAGNFSAAQIFDSFTSSGGAGYEDLARRNVSQMISSQLERYAAGLIKGVDLNVGLQSSGGIAEGGSDRSTNLNLGVSKRLANDRLIFSVGKNFELENKDLQSDEIFDNVEANWLITTDGRYRLKVFRKNRNQSAIEGSVIETGLGFIIAIDYDTWKELMKRKK